MDFYDQFRQILGGSIERSTVKKICNTINNGGNEYALREILRENEIDMNAATVLATYNKTFSTLAQWRKSQNTGYGQDTIW